MPQLPKTPNEWQEAVDAAHACLALESARLYGLVAGGPDVDVSRCVFILDQGAARDVHPRDGAIEAFARELSKPAGRR